MKGTLEEHPTPESLGQGLPHGQLSLEIGGEQPTISEVRLKGAVERVDRDLRKGEWVNGIRASGVVREVRLVDKLDKDGIFSHTERVHIIEVTHMVLTEA